MLQYNKIGGSGLAIGGSAQSVETPTSNQLNCQKVFGEQEFPVVAIVSHSRNTVDYTANCHPELEFHLIRYGTTRYVINGVNYVCVRNSLLLMHENEPHSWLCDPECPDKNMTLVFDPRLIEDREVSRTLLHRLTHLHHIVLADETANNAEFLLNEIAEECKYKVARWQEVVVEYLEAFLTIVCRTVDEQIPLAQSEDTVIKEIIHCLEDRFSEKLSLVDMAKKFNLSPSVLSKKFKQHAGIGFREYLIRRRIVAAQKLLEETDLKVAAVASKAGFDSLTTFNRDFRLVTGVAPAVYRTVAEAHKPA